MICDGLGASYRERFEGIPDGWPGANDKPP
jgi:hypothetical protein